MRNVAGDMKLSAEAFSTLVWPIVQDRMGGTLLLMESVKDSEFASLLDMYSGIDGWNIGTGKMRGIASRVQADKDWGTFTIRKSRDSGALTEFEKRRQAIDSKEGWVFPHFTIQSYLKTWAGPVLSIGVTRTIDAIRFVVDGRALVRRTTNAEFYVCDWCEMKAFGYPVWTWPSAPPVVTDFQSMRSRPGGILD